MWCKRIRQERANRVGTKANVFPVVITHPEKMVSVGGAVIERPTCGASSCSWIVLCVYINSSLLPIVIFVSGCVFSSYLALLIKICLTNLRMSLACVCPLKCLKGTTRSQKCRQDEIK